MVNMELFRSNFARFQPFPLFELRNVNNIGRFLLASFCIQMVYTGVVFKIESIQLTEGSSYTTKKKLLPYANGVQLFFGFLIGNLLKGRRILTSYFLLGLVMIVSVAVFILREIYEPSFFDRASFWYVFDTVPAIAALSKTQFTLILALHFTLTSL